MNEKPSIFLPEWAKLYFIRQKDHFDGYSENLPHRTDAFYRLLGGADSGKDIIAMWHRAEQFIPCFNPEFNNNGGYGGCESCWPDQRPIKPMERCDGPAFISSLIFATDCTIPEEFCRLPNYGRPPRQIEQRLRTSAQTCARKLARLLRDLNNITPSDCQAGKTMGWFGADIEALIIYYSFELEPYDLDGIRNEPARLAIAFEGKTRAEREALLRELFDTVLGKLSSWQQAGAEDNDDDTHERAA